MIPAPPDFQPARGTPAGASAVPAFARGWLRPFTRLPLVALLALALLAAAPQPAGAQQSLGKLFREGQHLLRAKRPAEAEAVWQEVLRRAPNHFNAHLALGQLYIGRDADRAHRHLEAARDLRPGSDAVHYHLGRLLETEGKLEQAAESYRQAIRLNARHYAANGRLRSIIRTLRSRQTAVERASEQFWVKPSLAALTLYGQVVMQESDPRQALWEFEVLRERLPKMPEVNLWVARAQRRLGSLRGEIEAYRAYLGEDAEATGVWLLMLDRLLDAGEYRGAAEPLAELERRAATGGMRPREEARLRFLKSRLLSVQGDPAGAGELLLAAGLEGYEAAQVNEAFRRNVALYPRAGPLWMTYGKWLKTTLAHDEAAGAFLKAGRLAPALQDEAVALLQELARAGTAQITVSLALGELAVVRGDQNEAIARLREIPPGHAADARASLLLGTIYRERGELEQSLEAFIRYVFSFPDRPGMAFARGNIFWEMGQRDVATAIWANNLDELGGYPDALTLMAEYLSGRADAAAREIAVRRKLAAVAPEDVPNRLRLGDLLAAHGEQDAAALQWEEAARHKPGDFALLVRLGKAHLERGDLDRGAEALQRASQIGTLELPLAERLARHLMAKRRFEEALAFYWQIYRNHPDHPDLPRVLPELVVNAPATPAQRIAAARMAEKSERPELAIDLLEELIRRNVATEESRLMLAGLYLVNDEVTEAERVIQGAGGSAGLSGIQALRLLATAQRRLDKKDELSTTLHGILAAEPGNVDVARELGFLLLELNRGREAYKFLSMALPTHPDDPELLLRLAESASVRGEPNRALAHLKRLEQVAPGHPEGRALKTEVLQQAQRWEELARHLETIVAEHPKDVDARLRLVTAYLNLFEQERARPHFEALERLSPAKARRLRHYFR